MLQFANLKLTDKIINYSDELQQKLQQKSGKTMNVKDVQTTTNQKIILKQISSSDR